MTFLETLVWGFLLGLGGLRRFSLALPPLEVVGRLRRVPGYNFWGRREMQMVGAHVTVQCCCFSIYCRHGSIQLKKIPSHAPTLLISSLNHVLIVLPCNISRLCLVKVYCTKHPPPSLFSCFSSTCKLCREKNNGYTAPNITPPNV